jgi:hypothetical protein
MIILDQQKRCIALANVPFWGFLLLHSILKKLLPCVSAKNIGNVVIYWELKTYDNRD